MKKTSEIIWQDKQHQVLFGLIEQINNSEFDARIFKQLFDYAENHFTMEEEYMLKLSYPDRQKHIQAHDKFRDELHSMLNEHNSYDDLFRQLLSEFLSNWLKSHIFGLDKKLEDFILKSDYK